MRDGSRVRLTGLSHATLNGAEGRVIGDLAGGRLPIRLFGAAGQAHPAGVRIKPQNLECIEPMPERAAGEQALATSLCDLGPDVLAYMWRLTFGAPGGLTKKDVIALRQTCYALCASTGAALGDSAWLEVCVNVFSNGDGSWAATQQKTLHAALDTLQQLPHGATLRRLRVEAGVGPNSVTTEFFTHPRVQPRLAGLRSLEYNVIDWQYRADIPDEDPEVPQAIVSACPNLLCLSLTLPERDALVHVSALSRLTRLTDLSLEFQSPQGFARSQFLSSDLPPSLTRLRVSVDLGHSLLYLEDPPHLTGPERVFRGCSPAFFGSLAALELSVNLDPDEEEEGLLESFLHLLDEEFLQFVTTLEITRREAGPYEDLFDVRSRPGVLTLLGRQARRLHTLRLPTAVLHHRCTQQLLLSFPALRSVHAAEMEPRARLRGVGQCGWEELTLRDVPSPKAAALLPPVRLRASVWHWFLGPRQDDEEDAYEESAQAEVWAATQALARRPTDGLPRKLTLQWRRRPCHDPRPLGHFFVVAALLPLAAAGLEELELVGFRVNAGLLAAARTVAPRLRRLSLQRCGLHADAYPVLRRACFLPSLAELAVRHCHSLEPQPKVESLGQRWLRFWGWSAKPPMAADMVSELVGVAQEVREGLKIRVTVALGPAVRDRMAAAAEEVHRVRQAAGKPPVEVVFGEERERPDDGKGEEMDEDDAQFSEEEGEEEGEDEEEEEGEDEDVDW